MDTPIPAEAPMASPRPPVSRPLVVVAVLVFLLSLLGSVIVTVQANAQLGQDLIAESPTAASVVLDQASGADASTHVLLNRVVDAELEIRAAQNHQARSIIALSAAFSLIAIGFALFVLGIEGMFSLTGTLREGQTFSFNAAMPGLLCMVLAATLVAVVLMVPTPERSESLTMLATPPPAAQP